MKYAVVFGTLGATCLYYAWALEALPLRTLALWGAMAFGGVGAAYAGVGARIFGKRDDGRLHPVIAFCFGPYHVLNWLGLWSFRRQKREAAFNHITERVVLGCRLNMSDEAAFQALGAVAVLDVCGEFAEVAFVQRHAGETLNYKSLPVLDAKAPSLANLEMGAQWIEEKTARGPVYVHCALGHGRSATFVAAYLLQTKQAQNSEEAVALVAAQRPRIGLSHEQMMRLREWEAKDHTKHAVQGY